MKDVKIEINGLKEVQDAIRAYQGDISKQLGIIVDAAALEAVTTLLAVFAQSTGERFKIDNVVEVMRRMYKKKIATRASRNATEHIAMECARLAWGNKGEGRKDDDDDGEDGEDGDK